MKVIFNKDFDFDLGGGKTAFARASAEPATVKRDMGEAAIAAGFAILADADTVGSDAKAGDMGGDDTRQADSEVSGPAGIDIVDGVDDGAALAKSKSAKAR